MVEMGPAQGVTCFLEKPCSGSSWSNHIPWPLCVDPTKSCFSLLCPDRAIFLLPYGRHKGFHKNLISCLLNAESIPGITLGAFHFLSSRYPLAGSHFRQVHQPVHPLILLFLSKRARRRQRRASRGPQSACPVSLLLPQAASSQHPLSSRAALFKAVHRPGLSSRLSTAAV